jgi:hypothetical protein
MENNDDNLKLIYIYKNGHNIKGESMYEFIFSKDPSNIDAEEWGWNLSPACDNAEPPSENYIDATITLRTKQFNLFCLHESVNHEYIHGYHTIHALAYESENIDEDGYESYENMFDDNFDMPLLVFHYGTSLKQIKDLLNPRNVIFKNNEFVDISSIKL